MSSSSSSAKKERRYKKDRERTDSSDATADSPDTAKKGTRSSSRRKRDSSLPSSPSPASERDSLSQSSPQSSPHRRRERRTSGGVAGHHRLAASTSASPSSSRRTGSPLGSKTSSASASSPPKTSSRKSGSSRGKSRKDRHPTHKQSKKRESVASSSESESESESESSDQKESETAKEKEEREKENVYRLVLQKSPDEDVHCEVEVDKVRSLDSLILTLRRQALMPMYSKFTYKLWLFDEEEETYPVDPIQRLDQLPLRGTVRIERYIDENSAEGRKLKQQRQLQHMREKRTHIARELLHTEREYVKNMNILLEVFLIPLQEHNDQVPTLQPLLTDLQVIVGYNSILLSDLGARLEDWTPDSKMGDIFLKIASFLKAYKQYVAHYTKANIRLRQLHKKNKQVDLLLENMRRDAEDRCGKRGVKDFLIMPVQRIPRYLMLLQDLLRNTWAGHADLVQLQSAQKLVAEVAEDVENSQNEIAQANKVLEVADRLTGKLAEELELVQPHRRFIAECDAYVAMDGKRGSDMHLFLFSDLLLLCKVKKLEVAKHIFFEQIKNLKVLDECSTIRVLVRNGYKPSIQFSGSDHFNSWKGLLQEGVASDLLRRKTKEEFAARRDSGEYHLTKQGRRESGKSRWK